MASCTQANGFARFSGLSAQLRVLQVRKGSLRSMQREDWEGRSPRRPAHQVGRRREWFHQHLAAYDSNSHHLVPPALTTAALPINHTAIALSPLCGVYQLRH